MKMQHSLAQLSLVTAISLILSGCGGGGGGSTPPTALSPETPVTPETPVSPTPVEPTPTPTVGTLALTTDNFDDYSLLFNRSLYNEVNSIRNSYHNPTASMLRLTQSLWLNPSIATSLKTSFIDSLPAGAGTHNCTTGSMTRTIVDTNTDGQISQAGESEQLSFNNCSNGTITANGSLAYNLTAVTPTGIAATFTYSNLTAVQNGVTQTYQGSKSLAINTGAGLSVTTQVTSDLVSRTQNTTDINQTTQKTGYQSLYTESGTDWQVSLAGNMEIMVNNDKANLILGTATPLTGSMTASTYAATRTGEYSTSWNKQALKTNSNADGLLTMSADLDGNGSYEVSYQQAWDRLTIPE